MMSVAAVAPETSPPPTDAPAGPSLTGTSLRRQRSVAGTLLTSTVSSTADWPSLALTTGGEVLATVGGRSMTRVAPAEVIEPHGLLTMHEYRPASVAMLPAIVSVGVAAPEMRPASARLTPFLRHWYAKAV